MGKGQTTEPQLIPFSAESFPLEREEDLARRVARASDLAEEAHLAYKRASESFSGTAGEDEARSAMREWRRASNAHSSALHARTERGRQAEVARLALIRLTDALADIDLSHIHFDVAFKDYERRLEITSLTITDGRSEHVPDRGQRRSVIRVADGALDVTAVRRAIAKIEARYSGPAADVVPLRRR